MNNDDLSALYRGYISCLNSQDWPSLGKFVHDDVERNGNHLGLSGYVSMLQENYEDIPDLAFEIALLISDGTTVGCRLRFECTPKGEFLDLPINGKKITFNENVFYEFDAGKIKRVWSVIDKAAIEAQL